MSRPPIRDVQHNVCTLYMYSSFKDESCLENLESVYRIYPVGVCGEIEK